MNFKKQQKKRKILPCLSLSDEIRADLSFLVLFYIFQIFYNKYT